jgi:hypothetical protein
MDCTLIGMTIDFRTTVVLATVVVLGVGQSLSAQTHPVSFAAASADGPIARASARELAKLQQLGFAAEFDRDDRVTKGQPRYAVAPAGAARVSKRGAIGAVIGAAAGVLLGVGLAIGYATRDCGSSCTDERVMIGVSLVGIPVAGGLAGYHIAK